MTTVHFRVILSGFDFYKNVLGKMMKSYKINQYLFFIICILSFNEIKIMLKPFIGAFRYKHQVDRPPAVVL